MIDTSRARFEPSKVRAAVFDIGGVFLYPNYEAVAATLVESGFEAPSEVERYRQAHHAGCLALSAANAAVDEHNQDFWIAYDHAYAAELGLPPDQADRLRVAIRVAWEWPHQRNIDAFHQLAKTGLPVAIVSNNDGSAQQSMVDFGVCQVGPGPLPEVLAVVDSTVLGIAKPDPAIMSPALDAIGLPADQVLYVGDTVHADVVGATNAGMQVVQLDPFDHHRHYPHTRVADLAAVAAALAG